MARDSVTAQISVVIVNYNSGAALASTLESLSAGLTGLEWDAVVVDNASTDHSERAAQDEQRIRLLRHHSNVGFGSGVNIGTAATSAPFVLMLNPDCRLERGMGRSLLLELQRHEQCAVIGPAILDPSGTLQESARGDPDMLTGLFGRTSIPVACVSEFPARSSKPQGERAVECHGLEPASRLGVWRVHACQARGIRRRWRLR